MMKYTKIKLYRTSFYANAFAGCMNGDSATPGSSCVAGPDASGGCSNGAAANFQCQSGSAAAGKCEMGTGFE